jgi:hypothetical protein
LDNYQTRVSNRGNLFSVIQKLRGVLLDEEKMDKACKNAREGID